MIEIRWSNLLAFALIGIGLYVLLNNADAVRTFFDGLADAMPISHHRHRSSGLMSVLLCTLLCVAAYRLLTRRN